MAVGSLGFMLSLLWVSLVPSWRSASFGYVFFVLPRLVALGVRLSWSSRVHLPSCCMHVPFMVLGRAPRRPSDLFASLRAVIHCPSWLRCPLVPLGSFRFVLFRVFFAGGASLIAAWPLATSFLQSSLGLSSLRGLSFSFFSCGVFAASWHLMSLANLSSLLHPPLVALDSLWSYWALFVLHQSLLGPRSSPLPSALLCAPSCLTSLGLDALRPCARLDLGERAAPIRLVWLAHARMPDHVTLHKLHVSQACFVPILAGRASHACHDFFPKMTAVIFVVSFLLLPDGCGGHHLQAWPVVGDRVWGWVTVVP